MSARRNPRPRVSERACASCANEKLDAVARLAGEVAHEMNQVLVALAPAPGDEEARAAYARGADLARRLLGLSRHQEVTAEPMDLGNALRELLPAIRDAAGTSVEVVLDVAPVAPVVSLCPQGLHRAMLALTSWARVSVGGAGRMRVLLSGEPDHVALEVEHDGTPLDDDDAPRLFDPYVGPHGIELTFVHAFAKRAGGRVEAPPGRSVRLVLPAARGPLVERGAMPAPAIGGAVLLVDDEPIVRKSLTRFLERSGLRVLSAGDASRALELARLHRDEIGALLLDVRMPDVTGPELALELARAGVAAPALFMSGYVPGDVDVERLRAEGAYVQKPFVLDELVRRLRRMLGEEN